MSAYRHRAKALVERVLDRVYQTGGAPSDIRLVRFVIEEDLARMVEDELAEAVQDETIACATVADAIALRFARVLTRYDVDDPKAVRIFGRCAGAARVHAALEERLPVGERLPGGSRA